ncbi:YitT family protein [Paucilactobacillus nenjiangensis]|uniref:YitT family protein n=1 Tax=Paucilactobacillus nenjiangensis TaxID=1296540 RepID=UPI003BAFF55A
MRLPIHKPIFRGFLMIVALEIIAIAINMFFAPHEVAAGGATGMAILVQEAFNVPLWITTLVINIAMLGLAFSFLSGSTTRRILFGSLALPVLLSITPQMMLIQDRLLAIIIGSIVIATGFALNYRIDASSGGTTVPPMVFAKYFKLRPSIGLLIVDFVVCLFNIPVTGFDAFALAIFSVGITSLAMNFIETGFDRKKAVYIMSNQQLPEIKQAILANNDFGLTVHQVIGGYSNETREMLMVVVEQRDFRHLVNKVHKHDPGAFIIATEATEVHGGSI